MIAGIGKRESGSLVEELLEAYEYRVREYIASGHEIPLTKEEDIRLDLKNLAFFRDDMSVNDFILTYALILIHNKRTQLEDSEEQDDRIGISGAIGIEDISCICKLIGNESKYTNLFDQDAPCLIKVAHELHYFLNTLGKTDFKQMNREVIEGKVGGLENGKRFKGVLSFYVKGGPEDLDEHQLSLLNSVIRGIDIAKRGCNIQEIALRRPITVDKQVIFVQNSLVQQSVLDKRGKNVYVQEQSKRSTTVAF